MNKHHFEINENFQIDFDGYDIYFSDTPAAMIVSCPIEEIKLFISILKEIKEVYKEK